MSIFSRILGRTKTKSATITLIGPSRSGKTTLVRYIESGEEVTDQIHTTLGIEIRKKEVDFDGVKIRAIDTGGQKLYQETFWDLAIQQADAVIFVIDATIRKEVDAEAYQLSRDQFQFSLDLLPEDMPLLVLLNKQDLVQFNPMTPRDAFDMFNLDSYPDLNVEYLPISAKYGNGVEKAMSWLVDAIESQ